MATVIINNTNTINEDAIRLNGLVQYFPDPDTAAPLSNAQLFFGLVSQDPSIESNQKLVYAIQEDKTVIAIPQPVRTTAGGVPTYNNSPVTLAIEDSFSFKCLDQDNSQKYYFPFVSGLSTFNFSGEVKEEKVSYTGSSFFTFQFIECTTASFYKSSTVNAFFDGVLLQKDTDYRVISPTQIELLGTVVATDQVLGRQGDTVGSGDSELSKGAKVYAQPTISDAQLVNFEIGDNVLIAGKDTVNDDLGGKYLCVAGGTGSIDNENFISLDNGNQLQLIGSNRKLSKYVDTTAIAELSSGVITANLALGTAQKITLTDNVAGLSVLNKNPKQQTNFTLEVVQGSTLYNITWPANINWSGGIAPAITQTIGKRDRFGFISNGNYWDGVVIGQDFD